MVAILDIDLTTDKNALWAQIDVKESIESWIRIEIMHCFNSGFKTELKSEDPFKIERPTDKNTIITCSRALRKNTGKYTLTIKNQHGSDSATVEVVILGGYTSNIRE